MDYAPLAMKRLHFESIDSTHLFAKRSISRLKAYDLTVITADFQTGGIGRRLDRWVAGDKSSLLVSFVYRIEDKAQLPFVSKWCAEALKMTLEPLNLPITFKYPNDLMVNGKKLSGVISESCDGMMISSVGLNMHQTEKEMAEIDQPATSLYIETGKRLSSEKILTNLLHHYYNRLACS